MDGDLSLSQSFGGLRIANPDRGSPDSSSQARTATPPSVARRATSSTTADSPEPQHQRRLSLFNLLRRGEPSNEPPAVLRKPSPTMDSQQSQPAPPQRPSPPLPSDPIMASQDSARAAAAQQYRQSQPSMAPSHQAQQDALYPPFAAGHPQSRDRNLVAPRPVSGMYSPIAPPMQQQQQQQPQNTMPNRQHGSYRLRTEGPRSSMLQMPARSDRSESRVAEAMSSGGTDTRDGNHRERSYSQGKTMAPGQEPVPSRQSSRNMGNMGIGRMPSQQGGPLQPNPNQASYGMDGPLMQSSEEWKERGAAVGVRQELDANGKPILRSVKKGVRDFAFGRNLGEGSYSTVLAATDRQTLKEYAVKVLDKRHIIKEKKIKYVNIEKNTLNRLTEHPGIVRLYYTFQDEKSLYYVLDVASNGELLGVLKKMGTFDVECTRFYGAQILDAIDYMHSRGVIHRDLKPENVLLDDQMHVKITDFGTAKLLRDPFARDGNGPSPTEADDDQRAASFVGTAEYVSPELLTDKNACKASDLWAFGCIIYQLLSGRPPFKAANEYLTFQKIVQLDYEFPPGFPPTARDLVERLLVHDPQQRLSMEHIKNHEFFEGIKWGRGLWRQKAPRLKPYVPPAQEPKIISLNGSYGGSTQQGSAAPPPRVNGAGNAPPARPARIITELPPPSQLDIAWSPVLTRNNERILKLGNLMVTTSPIGNSPDPAAKEKKFSRFFGGGTTVRKKQRLVLITSAGRIILAPSGGDEKKAKTEISLLASDCTWRIDKSEKGVVGWSVDTRGTHYAFEDLRSATPVEPGRTTAEEWIETLEAARDFAMSQNMGSRGNGGDGDYDGVGSSVSSPTSTLGGQSVYQEGYGEQSRHGHGRFLTKSQASLQGPDGPDGGKERKHRFSKRSSKNGLAAVF